MVRWDDQIYYYYLCYLYKAPKIKIKKIKENANKNVLNKDEDYFEKNDVSFVVHFCVGKYSFSLDIL